MKRSLAIVALALGGCSGHRAEVAGPAPVVADALVGLWASEVAHAPGLHGELTVTREGAGFRAALAGAEARSTASGDGVRLAFTGDGGELRGALADGGRTLSGFWLQPPGPAEDAQGFASPLVLAGAGPGVWRGVVRPLEDRFTLYLQIDRDADGTLVAAFLNPERNARGGAARLKVARDGDALRFVARPDPARPEIALPATYARAPDRVRVAWPGSGAIELTRATPAQIAAFTPRPPGQAAYAYRAPSAAPDGWSTARARDVDLDESALARTVERLIATDPKTARPRLVHSILIARRGKLVLEEYFFGFDRDTPHDLRSAGKTFASVMLGAAMAQGAKISPESTIAELFAGMGPFQHPDPRKSKITLADLMTHTSGLACDDNDDASPGGEDAMQGQHAQPNWWKHTLDLPIAHEPGARYAYCSAGINLVGAALTHATGTWLPELFERTVARPLEFGPYYWNLMPTNEGYLGGGTYLRPRDLLKVGQTWLDGGVWRGRRIVDESWVGRSTAPHAEISPASTGLDPEKFRQSYQPAKDGYAWHLHEVRAGGRAYREYEASGNGGQLLMVVPDAELAVVITAGNFGQGGVWGRFRDEIVGGEILAAIAR